MDRATVPVVGALLLLVYLLNRQSVYWSDGRFFVHWLENDRWQSRHLAYLPVAQSIRHTLGAALGWSTEFNLVFLSAICGAFSGAMLLAACRQLSLSWTATVVSTLLMATAPVVWFYSTSVEVHTLQLAGASCAVAWGARAWARGRLGGNSIAPLLVLAAVALPHIIGIVWVPALAALTVLGSRTPPRLRLDGRRIATLILLVSIAAGVWLVQAERPATTKSLSSDNFDPSLALVWREVIAPAGVLYFVAALALAFLARRSAGRFWTTPSIVSLLLFAALVPLSLVTDIKEKGAYFVSLLPVASLWAAIFLDRIPRLAVASVGLVLIGLQLHLSLSQVRQWEAGVQVPSWLSEFETESNGQALIVTLNRSGANAISRHTNVLIFPILAKEGVDRRGRKWRKRTVGLALEKSSEGFLIGMMEDVASSTKPGVRAIVSKLVDELGEPRPHGEAPLLVFPRPREHEPGSSAPSAK